MRPADPRSLEAALEEITESGALVPGRQYVVHAYHDPECPFLLGGECRCAPDIEVVELKKDASAAPSCGKAEDTNGT